MAALFIAVMLVQERGCADIASAKAMADAFDLRGAVERLDAAARTDCPGARVQATYLRAWIGAREAYRLGGSPESLRTVDAALPALKGESEVAFYVLKAASAAAQSERDELRLMIEQAVQLESIRLDAGLPGVPIITAHEAAGELWLQVHRYDEARRAFQRAAERLGATPRITLGLARAAARLRDIPEACRRYAALAAAWKDPRRQPPEIGEAIRFPQDFRCTPSAR